MAFSHVPTLKNINSIKTKEAGEEALKLSSYGAL